MLLHYYSIALPFSQEGNFVTKGIKTIILMNDPDRKSLKQVMSVLVDLFYCLLEYSLRSSFLILFVHSHTRNVASGINVSVTQRSSFLTLLDSSHTRNVASGITVKFFIF